MTRDEFADKITEVGQATLDSKGLTQDQQLAMLTQNATALIGHQLCDLEATLAKGLADIAAAVKGPTTLGPHDIVTGSPRVAPNLDNVRGADEPSREDWP